MDIIVQCPSKDHATNFALACLACLLFKVWVLRFRVCGAMMIIVIVMTMLLLVVVVAVDDDDDDDDDYDNNHVLRT